MGTYGRHVTVLQPPFHEHRLGRYKVGGDDILQWAPVVAGTDLDSNGRRSLSLCTGATEPVAGKHGLVCYEQPDANFRTFDPMLTGPSDLDKAPAGRPAQLVHGTEVRVQYRNYDAFTVDGQRTYPGRVVVAGAAILTPTIAIDDYLTPGVGTDEDGYWAEGNASNGWLIVTAVDHDRGLVQCQMTF